MAQRFSSQLLTSSMRSRKPASLTLARVRPLPSMLAAGAIRHASYYPTLEDSNKRGIKLGHIFSALALLGISATAYGLYDFYQSFTVYPSPVRAHLRTALRAANDGSYGRASSSFEAAYSLARELAGKNELADDRETSLMRSTGVAVRWGAMWEQAGELNEAIAAYDKGLAEVLALVDSGTRLSKNEMMRGVAISMKIGDLAVLTGTKAGEKQAEERYSWCVQEMMRLGMTPEQLDKVRDELESQQTRGASSAPVDAPSSSKTEQDETDLPDWLESVELVAGMERLGELYAKQGRVEYAQPLLQQTIALLIPPPKKDGVKRPPPPIANRCHAATLMNNLASVLVSDPSPSASAIDASARWARQSLTVSNQARKEAEAKRKGAAVPLADQEEAECQLVAITGSFNLGKLSELSKDKKSARAWFEKSRNQAARIGSKAGVEQSMEALRRL